MQPAGAKSDAEAEAEAEAFEVDLSLEFAELEDAAAAIELQGPAAAVGRAVTAASAASAAGAARLKAELQAMRAELEGLGGVTPRRVLVRRLERHAAGAAAALVVQGEESLRTTLLAALEESTWSWLSESTRGYPLDDGDAEGGEGRRWVHGLAVACSEDVLLPRAPAEILDELRAEAAENLRMGSALRARVAALRESVEARVAQQSGERWATRTRGAAVPEPEPEPAAMTTTTGCQTLD